jgi:hypothetical protein
MGKRFEWWHGDERMNEKEARKLEAFKAIVAQLESLPDDDRQRVMAAVLELWPLARVVTMTQKAGT